MFRRSSQTVLTFALLLAVVLPGGAQAEDLAAYVAELNALESQLLEQTNTQIVVPQGVVAQPQQGWQVQQLHQAQSDDAMQANLADHDAWLRRQMAQIRVDRQVAEQRRIERDYAQRREHDLYEQRLYNQRRQQEIDNDRLYDQRRQRQLESGRLYNQRRQRQLENNRQYEQRRRSQDDEHRRVEAQLYEQRRQREMEEQRLYEQRRRAQDDAARRAAERRR